MMMPEYLVYVTCSSSAPLSVDMDGVMQGDFKDFNLLKFFFVVVVLNRLMSGCSLDWLKANSVREVKQYKTEASG